MLFDHYISVAVCMWFAQTYQISSKSNHLGAVMTSYRFLKWRPWCRKSTSGCSFNDGTGLRKSKSISIPNFKRYLNPRLSYYYFRFRKMDVCHIGILLPVSILIYSSSSARDVASAYQISSQSVNPQWSYMSYRFFKNQDSGYGVANLLPVAGFSDVSRLKRSRSICRPNLDEISQSLAELLPYTSETF